MNKDSKKKTFKKITAVLLASAMVALGLTQGASVQANVEPTFYEADNSTKDQYTELFTDSTLHTGRIWVDKTVEKGKETYDKNGPDFNVTLSALSSANNINKKVAVSQPLDIVMVLDVSGSMKDEMKSYSYTEINYTEMNKKKTYYIKDATVSAGYREISYDKDHKEWGYYSTVIFIELWNPVDVTSIPVYQRKKGTSTTKIAALKKATKSFLDKVEEENQKAVSPEKKHRVAVVKFADDSYGDDDKNTTNEKEYNHTQTIVTFKEGQYCEGSNKTHIVNEINSIKEAGATAADYGFDRAKREIDKARPEAKKIVIFFTDGKPNHDSGFTDSVANATISKSKELKEKGTDVYSIAVFAGADPTADPTKKDAAQFDKYMQGVSSNYKNATTYKNLGTRTEGGNYYLTATDQEGLVSIFKQILEDQKDFSGYATETDVAHPEKSGYITFTDTLGKFMEIDLDQLQTNLAVYYNGEKISTTVKKTNNIDSSLGDEYQFEGTLKTNWKDGNGNQKEYSLSNLKVYIKNENGQQVVTVKIPAALLPVWWSDVTDNKVTSTPAAPIQIVYPVSLNKEIKAQIESGNLSEDLQKYVDKNGAASFYSNEYCSTKTTATYVPNQTNDYYYYSEDTILYEDAAVDENQHLQNVAEYSENMSGTFYVEKEYFTKEGAKIVNGPITVGNKASDDFKPTEIKQDAQGRPIVPAGTSRQRLIKDLNREKTENKTKTLEKSSDRIWNEKNIDVTLGNNGKITYQMPGTLVVAKKVTSDEPEVDFANKEFEFTLNLQQDGKNVANEFSVEYLDENGDVLQQLTPNQAKSTTIQNGGKFYLKQNQKMRIKGIPSGVSYTVTETSTNGYVSPEAQNGTIQSNEVTEVLVVNQFKPNPVVIGDTEDTAIKINKKISGREKVTEADENGWLSDETYEFTLTTANENADIETPTITLTKENQSANFGKITFNKAGEYVFTITETDRQYKNVSIANPQTITIKVVADPLDGSLKIDDSVKAELNKTYQFVNTYKGGEEIVVNPTDLGFPMKKVIEGREFKDTDTFTFLIQKFDKETGKVFEDAKREITIDSLHGTSAEVNTNEFTFTTPGVYQYSLTEVIPAEPIPGIIYSNERYVLEVTVKDTGKGTLELVPYDASGKLFKLEKLKDTNLEPGQSASWEAAEQAVFTNTHVDAAVLNLSGIKTLENKNLQDFVESKMFAMLTPMGLKEINSEDGFKVDSKQPSLSEEKLSMPIELVTGEYNFEGIQFPKESVNKVYRYKITEAQPTSTGYADGQPFEGASKDPTTDKLTYNGMIFDNKEYLIDVKAELIGDEVVLTVTDENGESLDVTQLNFTNKYDAGEIIVDPNKDSASEEIGFTKELTGREWTETDEFTFELVNVTGTEEQVIERKNATKANKVVKFSEIKFDFDTMDWTDSYIVDQSQSPWHRAKDFKYVVREVKGEDSFITYSNNVASFTITVVDDSQGHLTAKLKSTGGSHTFTNVYTPTPVVVDPTKDPDDPEDKDSDSNDHVDIPFKKVIDGREWKDGIDTYTFIIEAVTEGAPMPEMDKRVKVVQQKNEKFDFGTITYTKADLAGEMSKEFTYRVSEVQPAEEDKIPGIQYDAKSIEFTVVLSDDGQGNLTATSTVANPVFTNTYTTEDIVVDPEDDPNDQDAVDIQFEKQISGRQWNTTLDVYNFEIKAITENAPMPKNPTIEVKENATDFNFGTITFQKSDLAGQMSKEFTYQVSEVIPAEKDKIPGVQYDAIPVQFTIVVTDDGNGHLTAMSETNSIVFTNTYKPDDIIVNPEDDPKDQDDVDIQFEKQISGRQWNNKSDTFTFKIEAINDGIVVEDGTIPMPTNPTIEVKENAKDFNFGTIRFQKSDLDGQMSKEFTYRVSEVIPAEEDKIPGIQYDAEPVQFTIVVTDDGNGHLTATSITKEAKFVNEYKPTPIVVDPTEDPTDPTPDADPDDVDIPFKKEIKGREMNAEDTFTFKIEAVTEGAPMPDVEKQTTTVSKGNPEFDFGTITYTKADLAGEMSKEFTYRVSEVQPAEEDKIPGIQYDAKSIEFTVVLSDDGQGNLTATSTVANPVFTNTYKAKKATLDGNANLMVEKQVNGRDFIEGDEFTFELTPVEEYEGVTLENTQVSIKNAEEAKGTAFGNITFTKAGTYEFNIHETSTTAGVTNATDQKVVIEVTPNYAEGKLEAKRTDTSTLEFVNNYNSESFTLVGKDHLVVKKTINGRDFIEGDEFTFELTPVEEYEGVTLENTQVSIKNAEEAKGTAFGNITFTKAGTYEFNIHETSTTAGVTNATDQKVVIEVTPNYAEGKLEAKRTDKSTLKFVNKYSPDTETKVDPNPTPDPDEEDPTDPDAVLDGFAKVLEGRNWKENETFEFVLQQTSGPKVDGEYYSETITVNESAQKARFANLVYTPAMMEGKKEQVFTYTVKEVAPKDVVDGLTYDRHVVEITVTVRDMNDGTLKATIEQTGSHVFTNVYSPDGSEEIDPTGADVNAPLKKTLKNYTWDKVKDGFVFELTGLDGAPMPENSNGNKKQITITEANQVFDFGKVTFTSEDMKDVERDENGYKVKEFKYTVHEVIPENNTDNVIDGMKYDSHVVTFTVVVTDDNTGKLKAHVANTVTGSTEFINEFTSERDYEDRDNPNGQSGLDLVKTLKNHDMMNKQFEFVVKAMDQDSIDKLGAKQKVVTTADKVIAAEATDVVQPFADMKFDGNDIGKTFTYEISEKTNKVPTGYTYDESTYIVEITVTELENGALLPVTVVTKDNNKVTYQGEVAKVTFVNTFEADGSINDPEDPKGVKIHATKTLIGRDMAENEFTFKVVNTKNANDVTYGHNLKATDSEAAQVVFEKMSYDMEKLTSDAAQGFATHTPGTNEYFYEYEVSEVTENMPAGVSNTNTPFIITVKVTVEKDAVLGFEITYPQGSNNLEFINTYNTSEIDFVINGHKVLNVLTNNSSMTLEDIAGKFNFTIIADQPEFIPVENVDEEVVEAEVPQLFVADPANKDDYLPQPNTATNDKAGNVMFGTIHFDEKALSGVQPDENGVRTIKFNYHVIEEGTVPGITNDSAEHTFSIVVTDDGQGNLTASLQGVEALTFINTYKAEETSSSVTKEVNGNVKMTKKLVGRDMKDKEFHFVMYEKDGSRKAEGTNDVNGNIEMSSIQFTEPGEFVFVVSEVAENGTYNGVTYDGNTFEVKAIVEEKDGKLTVKWTSEVESVVFNNTYEAKATEQRFGAVKLLCGRDLKANEFEFVLKDSAGRVIDTAKNDKNGAVKFDAVEFTKPGTYTYTISEVKGEDKDITYDATVYKVVLEVTDNGQGYLEISEKEEQTLVFTNIYTKPEEPTKPEKPEEPKKDSNTGLATNANTWMGMMAISGTALAGISYKKRKSNKK